MYAILKFLRIDTWYVGLGVAYSALNKVFDLLPEFGLTFAIDSILHPKTSILATWFGVQDPYYQLYCIGGGVIVCWIIQEVFEYLYIVRWYESAQYIMHEIRIQLYAAIQKQDSAFFRTYSSAYLLSLLQDDLEKFEDFVRTGLNEIIQCAVNALIIGIFFYWVSPVFFVCMIALLPVVFLTVRYYQKRLTAMSMRIRGLLINLVNYISYKLHGIATIKSYTTQQYELNQVLKESVVYKNAQNEYGQLYGVYVPTIHLLLLLGYSIALFLGGMYTLQGVISVSVFPVILSLTQKFLWPFTRFVAALELYEKSEASAHRILEILQSKSEIHDGSLVLPETIQGSIECKNITFSYDEKSVIFKDLSLSIPSKTTVAFVGTTGSGKSTIVSLLLRFYDPVRGSVTIDGYDIKDLTLQNVRSHIALVSQDVYMVQGTIAENIAYGTFNATREQIEQAAQMAQAHDFIMRLPQGYDTQVEEYGKNLSGGQRQRISIARALLKKSEILIFDEATSAVDNETESAIQESLLALQGKHTIIIIAHRLLTVRDADMIYVLDKGTIVESGTHAQLLEKQGMYAGFVQ
ncbi:ABC transporter ATP-binding protein, partial [bacterium]|nr:ABC transporter ATP-binding protein [bacterium]